MTDWNNIDNGERIELGLLQIDIAGHSFFRDNDKILQQTKILFRKLVEGIINSRGGRLFSWAGDGGSFMFLTGSGEGFNDLAFSAIQILKNLPFINEEVTIRSGFSDTISVRISGDSGIVVYDTDPSQISGNFVNKFCKYEREIGLTNTVTITKRVWQQLTNSLKKRFIVQKYSEELGIDIYSYSGESDVQVLPETPDRYQPIMDRLEKCKEREEVKFIAITGLGAMLSGPLPDQRGKLILDRAFPKALAKGVKFKGIVLNPESKEAEFRSNIETPNTPLEKRLLQRDANYVKSDLWLLYKRAEIEEDKIQNLKLKYTDTGIAFSMWIFDDVAFIEPIHFGKKDDDEHLCGFSRLKISKPSFNTSNSQNLFEYQILEKHFQILWNNSKEISSENSC